MGFLNIKIEKVIVQSDNEDLKEILCRIEKKLDEVLEDPTGEQKKEIYDKLVKAIADIKSTI